MKFPGLISGCTLDWFHPWPKDALRAVSAHFLSEYKLSCTDEVKTELIEVMGDVQDNVSDACFNYYNRFRRQCYVTPRSYLCYIEAYKSIYQQELENIQILAFRMSNGLNKLIDAAAQVDDLRQVLIKNQEEIAVKNVQVEKVSSMLYFRGICVLNTLV